MRKRVVSCIGILGLMFSTVASAFAATNITVRSEINKGFITIGERVQYTVLIRHRPEIRLLTQPQFPNPRDFEVKSVKEISPKSESGFVVTGRQFEIAAYGLGEFVIDEIPVQFVNDKGQTGEIRTSRIYVTVESVDKSGKPKTDIRGIKAPIDIPSAIKGWVIFLSTALGLVTAGVVTWHLWWRKKARALTEEKLLPPYDEACQALRRLFDSSLIREGRVKEYYFQLSEITRLYLERRFSFPATEQTTDEIGKKLKGLTLEPSTKEMMHRFLEDTDLVKFAKYMPEPREIVGMNKLATEILERTKPVEEIPEDTDIKTGS